MTHTRCALGFVLAASLSVVVAAQQPSAPAAPALSTPDQITAFASSLDACKPGKATTPHLLMKSFVIEHTVVGETNGACTYSQTMPGNMKMECSFSAAGRKAMAAELRNMATGGSMRGGTSQAQPEWAKECEIVTASGSRSPMAQSPRPR